MAKYEMKYMFDWGSETCLWSTNEASFEWYDYPVEINDLPISKEMKQRLEAVIDRHDKALNWSNPAGELLWDESQQKNFYKDAIDLYYSLCNELGSDYKVELWEKCLI